jgi:hypothetical protein
MNGKLHRYAGTGLDWTWEPIEGGYFALGVTEPEKMEIAIDRGVIGLVGNKPLRVFFLTSDHQGVDWRADINDYAPKQGAGGYLF